MVVYDTSLQKAFEAFHQAHPWVYQELVALARQTQALGFKTYSINSLFEVVRWHRDIGPVTATEDFKMNNNYRSRYARLIMAAEPDLKGFFEVRKLQTLTAADIEMLGLNTPKPSLFDVQPAKNAAAA